MTETMKGIHQKVLRPFIIILLALSISNTSNGQIIDLQGGKLNCDSAYTYFESEVCSSFLLGESIAKYDSLMVKVYKGIDTFLADDKKNKKEMLKDNPKQTFTNWTDYSKVKAMFILSNKIFKQYAVNEMMILGELYGEGRERAIAENYCLKKIYDYRIKDLVEILERWVN